MVSTWLTGLNVELRKLTRTSEGDLVLTWLTGLKRDLFKLTWTIEGE